MKVFKPNDDSPSHLPPYHDDIVDYLALAVICGMWFFVGAVMGIYFFQ